MKPTEVMIHERYIPMTLDARTRRLGAVWEMGEFFQRRCAGRRPVFITAHGKRIFNMDNLAAHLGRKLGVSRSTVWRWLRVYRRWGATGLDRQPRSDRGRSRYFLRHHPELATITMAMRAEGLTMRGTHLALMALCAKIREKACCYTTVRAFVQHMEFAVARRTNTQQNRRRLPGEGKELG